MPPSDSGAKETTLRAYDAVATALRTGEVDDFAALLDEDVVLIEAVSHPFPGGRWQGKDTVLEASNGIFSSVGLTGVQMHKIFDDGETVCAIVDITCTNSASAEFCMPVIEKWIVKDGKIVHIEPYYHDMPALKDHLAAGV